MKNNSKIAGAALSVALLVCALGQQARGATWGSIHANNRSFQPARAQHVERQEQRQVTREQSFRSVTPREHEMRTVVVPREHEFRSVPGVRPEVDIGRAREIEHREHEGWRAGIAEDHHRGAFWWGYRPGMFVPSLPLG